MELKRLVLFGDSVIASSVFTDVLGFTNALNENLLGRADVLVRGGSGYTSREIAPLTPAICALRPHLVLLGFGNSDSALAGQIQHVPLDEFRRNLEQIAGAIAENGAWPVILTPVAPNEKRIRCRKFDYPGTGFQQITSDLPPPARARPENPVSPERAGLIPPPHPLLLHPADLHGG